VSAPILLGTARSSELVPDVGSQITTNEFGMDVGLIRHHLGDQSSAQSLRPARGSAYSGQLPQFKGMLVHDHGIVGREAQAAFIDVEYRALNPDWKILPVRSHDQEYLDISGFVGPAINVRQRHVPVPHPLVTVKFSADKPTDKLGVTDTPSFLPKISRFVYPIYGITGGTIDNSTGHLEVSGFVVADIVHLIFIPAPDGWTCLKDDATPVCGGKLFQIEQQWKRFYWFAGFELP
jgi:hypothetical protein